MDVPCLYFLLIILEDMLLYLVPAEDCKTDKYGLLYTGSIHTTINGYTCQDWDSDVPHVHNYHSLASSENYCRNSHTEYLGPWCYTTNSDVRWDYCPVYECGSNCSTGFFLCNDGQWLLDYQRCNGVPECSSSEDEHDCDSVRECLEDDTGLSYRGKVNITESGITCQDWSSQSPHAHPFVEFVYSSNYCRNSELNALKPWCYTIDKDCRWQYCDIPLCEVDTTRDELPTQTTTTTGDASSITLIGMMDNKTTTESTTTQVTSTTTDVSVQPTICSQCLCSSSQIVMNRQELQDKLKDLYTLLSVNKRNTSSYLRAKSSATDNRLSSKFIGVTGVILLLSVVLFILVLDILPRK